MRLLHRPAGLNPAAVRVLLLPGAYHRAEDFLEQGFEAAVRARALDLDLVFAEPQLSHVGDRDWLAALIEQGLRPARAAGVRLWLGGISLGAFMALRAAAEAPDAVHGLCLIAPYLGSRIVAREIAALPALADWRPGPLAIEDDERAVWRQVQALRGGRTRVFLGLGAEDRFADTQRLLAAALPPSCTLTLPGGHDWPVWRELWDNFLDRDPADP